MSTLYIRLPSKAAADGAEHWLALPCQFALASHTGVIEREGVTPLSDMAGAVAAAQRVVLLLAASDVTLLQVKTPPLSIARLKSVLPNLIEDQLMADPAECVVVPGELADGLRTVAVVQRGWLDILSKTFTSFGARSLLALPTQLCLPFYPDQASAALTEQGGDIDIALRTSEQLGLGLPIMPETAHTAAAEVLRALRAILPGKAITLSVPQQRAAEYRQGMIDDAGLEPGISIIEDAWPRWIEAARAVSMNLLSGLGAGSGPQVDWRRWRWAMALAALVLIVNALGLNIGWWSMKREASSLRAGMRETYKSAYPKETVILDAAAQMRRKIDDAKRAAGLPAPDDFAQIAANFAEALTGESGDPMGRGKGGAASIASLEYRERSLLVHLKPDNQISMDKMKAALAARNLNLTSPSNGVWQIRSAK